MVQADKAEESQKIQNIPKPHSAICDHEIQVETGFFPTKMSV